MTNTVSLAEENSVEAKPPKDIYLIGAIAALIAALGFRRNLGAAEIPLITGFSPPSFSGWLVYVASRQHAVGVNVA